MGEKYRVESLIKLAEASWRDYSERRSVEWKVNFGLWAALGTFGGFMFQQQSVVPLWIAFATSLLLLCTFLVYTFLWKAEVQERNRLDVEAAQYYWTEVDKELRIQSPAVRTRRQGMTGWRRTHKSQVVITFLFVLLAALAVWAPRWAG